MFSLDTILIIACVTLVIIWVWDYRRWRRELPPGPPCIPLIGNLGQIDLTDELATFSRLRKLYGDVFCYVIGLQTTIVINGLNAIQDLMAKKGDSFTDRPEMSVVRRLSNNSGLFGTIGDTWKEHRSFAVRTIRNLGSSGQSIEETVQKEIEIFIEDIKKTKQKATDPSEILNLRIVSILRWLIFGKRIDDDEAKDRVLKLLSLIRDIVVDPSFVGIGLFIRTAEYLPGDPFGTKLRKERNMKIVSILQDEINLCKETHQEGTVRCFVDAYIQEQKRQARNQNSTFTDDQLVHTVRDFIVAGTDTTVTSLKWALVDLIRYPDVQQRMRQEINQAIGNSRLPCMKDKTKLPYCEAFIAESLRMSHVFPIPPSRSAKHDVKWGNYRIPRGAMVLINLESVAKDPVMFPNPNKFDVGRFLNEDGTFNSNKTIFPFSVGKRSCLGEGIARMELFLFLITLIQRFEILPEEGGCLPSTKPVMFATRFPEAFKVRFASISK